MIDLLSEISYEIMGIRWERYDAAYKIHPVQTFTPFEYSILQEQRIRVLINLRPSLTFFKHSWSL